MPPVRGKPEGVVRASAFRPGFKKPSPFLFQAGPGDHRGARVFFDLRGMLNGHGNSSATATELGTVISTWQHYSPPHPDSWGLPAFVWALPGGCRQCTSASAVVHCAHGASSHDTVTRRHGHGGGTAERAERPPPDPGALRPFQLFRWCRGFLGGGVGRPRPAPRLISPRPTTNPGEPKCVYGVVPPAIRTCGTRLLRAGRSPSIFRYCRER